MALLHQIHPKMVASKGIAILTPQEMRTTPFVLVLSPLFSVSVLLPLLLLILGTESKRLPTCKYPTSELCYYPITSQLSTQSPLECYEVVD